MTIKKYLENKEFQLRSRHIRTGKKINPKQNFSEFQIRSEQFLQENEQFCKHLFFYNYQT